MNRGHCTYIILLFRNFGYVLNALGMKIIATNVGNLIGSLFG